MDLFAKYSRCMSFRQRCGLLHIICFWECAALLRLRGHGEDVFLGLQILPLEVGEGNGIGDFDIEAW